jgi:hypothetical protein
MLHQPSQNVIVGVRQLLDQILDILKTCFQILFLCIILSAWLSWKRQEGRTNSLDEIPVHVFREQRFGQLAEEIFDDVANGVDIKVRISSEIDVAA